MKNDERDVACRRHEMGQKWIQNFSLEIVREETTWKS